MKEYRSSTFRSNQEDKYPFLPFFIRRSEKITSWKYFEFICFTLKTYCINEPWRVEVLPRLEYKNHLQTKNSMNVHSEIRMTVTF